MADETRPCPACGQTIQAAAVICRFCQYDFRTGMAGAPPPPPPAKSSNKMIWILVGCGCAALAIPVAAIVAAIAIPGLLAAQRAGNERNASASLKTLTSAEADFRSNDRDGNQVNDFWTGDVRQLHYFQIGNGSMIMLIEPSVADADASPSGGGARGTPKAGYWFAAVQTDESGRPYDRKEGRHPDKYAFCAYPAQYGAAGRMTFIVNEDNTLWKKDTGGRPVTEWPRNPPAEGWMKLD